MENQENPNPQKVVIIQNQKSTGLAIILALLFGPLGLLYATVPGGIIMLVVGVLIALITFGFGILLIFPICAIWAAIATNQYNEKIK